ncbi:MAG: YIP1 family protein [Oscillospiraceae bacterium]|nr:YIP1 family protein [Oscillospiraceae bacterium]
MQRLKRLLICFVVFVLVMQMRPSVSADTPYVTYTINGYGQIRQTQCAYLAHATLTKFGSEAMSEPSDICIAENGDIYVADSKNSRIMIGSADGELIGTIGEGELKTPRGVFVTDNYDVYVADRDAEKIFVFDKNGSKKCEYGKPDSPLYGDEVSFLPIKIAVNDAGIMFVVCESNTNGIVELSPNEGGTFLGYFGTNYAATSLTSIIYRAILTDAQRAKMVSNIPATPTNLTIDDKGLVYTVTRGSKNDTLKRLNIAGTNMISNHDDTYAATPAAVAAGNHDNVYVADQQGYIFEYNNEGEMLFVFGGPDDGTQRVGLSRLVSGVAVDDSDRIYVLDSDKAQIQIYAPTEFTDLLHNALYLYSKGRYTEAKEPLTQLLKMNSMYDYANKAMGSCYFQEENYAQALKYARLAKDHKGYSDAFWEIRNSWLKKNIMTVIMALVILWIAVTILKRADSKRHILDTPRKAIKKFKRKSFVSDICYAAYYMKKPSDAAYGIAAEGRASWLASTFLLLVFMAEFIILKYTRGFLTKSVMDGRYEILSDIGMIAGIAVAVTLCTYLVCTINEGEGTIKKIYTFFCYSLMPYILLTPITYILSHVLTTNEDFLVVMLGILIWGWVAVIMVIGLKEVNNFTAAETLKVILLTVFAALILALLIFIIYVLWAQVFEFVYAIISEGVYRLGS